MYLNVFPGWIYKLYGSNSFEERIVEKKSISGICLSHFGVAEEHEVCRPRFDKVNKYAELVDSIKHASNPPDTDKKHDS